MTTPIEERALNSELQELYMVGQCWLTELEFWNTELKFLENLTESFLIKETRIAALENLKLVEASYSQLANDLQNYLLRLQTLTAQANDFQLDLVETYAGLKQRLAEAAINYQMAKHDFFELIRPETLESETIAILS